MRLVDGMYLADSSFRRPLDMLFGDEQQEQRWEEQDRELLEEITRLSGRAAGQPARGGCARHLERRRAARLDRASDLRHARGHLAGHSPWHRSTR